MTRLAIEVDGEIREEKKEYDRHRYELLKSLNIETIRVKDNEVLNNVEAVLIRIADNLKERTNLMGKK